jgi:hypothetical protein
MGLRRKKKTHRAVRLSASQGAKVRRLLGLSPRAHLLVIQTEDDPRYRNGNGPGSERAAMIDTPRSHVLKLQTEE